MIDKDLSDAVFYNSGGIGNIYISKCGSKVFKVTFNISAYVNNIKWNSLLDGHIPCSKLLNFFIAPATCKLYSDDIILKFIHAQKSSMDNLFIKHCRDDEQRPPDFTSLPLYILVYDAYDCNAFGFLLNAPRAIVKRTLPFLVIWAFTCICSMNELKFYHNDFKLDNILLRRKFVPTILKIGNFVFENKTDFDFALNDFDMSFESSVFYDLKAFKNSLIRMSVQRGDIPDILDNTLFTSFDEDVIYIDKLREILISKATEPMKQYMCIRLF